MSAAGSFPLVILAHGYGGTPVAMSWLAENLASKGYVVVGPHFNDPPITDAAGFAQPLARRPLDIAFVAAEVQARARLRQGVLAASDPARTVLVGYSMGGYGVLTDAGASLDPSLVTLTCGALATYVRGGRDAGSLKVANVRAVIAISPAGRFAGGEAWGAGGLGAITAPTLFIVGSRDRLIGYDPGVKTLFDEEVHAPRYLLTFRNAGHSIGMNAAPQAMRGRLWDLDWFEDPVWRKDRVLAIETHFITAFLDRYVKGDLAKAAYLDVTEPVSDRGVWPQAPDDRYDAYSPGKAPITLWKGFQRDHATGLELRFNPAQP
jgi:dienelactone hydrolase